jgi:hypothetical protein
MDDTSPNTHRKAYRENHQSENLACCMHPKHIPTSREPHNEGSERKEQDYGQAHEDAVCGVDIVLQYLKCWRGRSLV